MSNTSEVLTRLKEFKKEATNLLSEARAIHVTAEGTLAERRQISDQLREVESACEQNDDTLLQIACAVASNLRTS